MGTAQDSPGNEARLPPPRPADPVGRGPQCSSAPTGTEAPGRHHGLSAAPMRPAVCTAQKMQTLRSGLRTLRAPRQDAWGVRWGPGRARLAASPAGAAQPPLGCRLPWRRRRPARRKLPGDRALSAPASFLLPRSTGTCAPDAKPAAPGVRATPGRTVGGCLGGWSSSPGFP